MKIYKSHGFECEKKLPTTLEDLFNQSIVEYEYEGQKRVLTVTYVRYFDQYVQENDIYNAEETNVPFYHIVALLVLMKNNGYVEGERLYYNNTKQFLNAFNKEDIDKALSTYNSL